MTESFVDRANGALREFRAKGPNRYEHSKAIFFLWEDCEAIKIEESQTLSNIFEHDFDFECSKITIPMQNAQEVASGAIQEFVGANESERNVLLAYYVGGGTVNKEGRKLHPAGYEDPAIDWTPLQQRLEACSLDVILILDCEYGVATKESRQGKKFPSFRRLPSQSDVMPSKKRMEILAAPTIPSSNEVSFTKAVIQALRNNTKGRSLNINLLRPDITKYLGERSPEYQKLVHVHGMSDITLWRTEPEPSAVIPINLGEELPHGENDSLIRMAKQAPIDLQPIRFVDVATKDSRSAEAQSFGFKIYLGDIQPEHEQSVREEFANWIGKGTPDHVIDLGLKRSQSWLLPSKAGEQRQPEAQLNAILTKLNDGINVEKVWNTRVGRYQRIIVLPVMWKNPGFQRNAGIEEELQKLANTFRKLFDCEVQDIYKIPSSRSHDSLRDTILEYVGTRGTPHSTPLTAKDLFIIIYNGHGNDTLGEGGKCVWSGPPNGATVNYTLIQQFWENSPCDIAQILDCCYAGNSYSKSPNVSKREILAASDPDHTTPTGKDSYMNRVREKLEALALKKQMFSLNEVHNQVVGETRIRNESIAKRNKATSGTETESARLRKKIIARPFYILEVGESSIKLRPKPGLTTSERAQTSGPPTPTSDGLIGYVYAKIPVRKADWEDEMESWRNASVVKFFSENTLRVELKGISK